MTGPLTDPVSVRRAGRAPVILDATVDLPSPSHDGDHRAAPGAGGWLAEHIPGSRHADLLHDLSDPAAGYHFAHPSPEALAAALARLGVTDGVPVVVYDRAGGIWAARLWWLLTWIGVEATVLDGGLRAWREAGLPVESGPASSSVPVPATALDPAVAGGAGGLTPRVRPGRWAERGDLEAWLAGGVEATVLCALNAEAYSGEVPTRYTRRGHIPGSGNLPARSLSGPDGRLLPEPALREALAGLLADPRPVWLYCGGGISAAGVALALAVLGRDDVALYDGSLEEWSADPALPLSLGLVPFSPAVRELLDRPEFAVLATAEPDGVAQLSVMWLARDGDSLVMATKGGRRKVANIRRDPRVTVLVHDRSRPTRYVEIRGTARVTGEDADQLVDALAVSYTGADHVRGTVEQEAGRVVVRITPTRVYERS
ncbi:TIGR03618 family F420-dependent PPOX class oxidoreductase [Actinoplanes sp. NPDC051494]|uniref:TIGR03618 family F420-dependent PPOX class oxidoreductase n=1 Tax=Actinoplanes sp. NPDC051494 TaxID=3363907 RepID=UPI0037ADBD9D